MTDKTNMFGVCITEYYKYEIILLESLPCSEALDGKVAVKFFPELVTKV
jgi:hypothetical protein